MIAFEANILSDRYPMYFPVVSVVVHKHSHSPTTFPAAYRKDRVVLQSFCALRNVNTQKFFLQHRSWSCNEIKTLMLVPFAGLDGVAVIRGVVYKFPDW